MDRRLLAIILLLGMAGFWVFSGDENSSTVDEKAIAQATLTELGCKEGNDICSLRQARELVNTDFGGAAFFCRSIEDEVLEDQCHYELAINLAEQGAYPSASDYCNVIKNNNPAYLSEGCKQKVLDLENEMAN